MARRLAQQDLMGRRRRHAVMGALLMLTIATVGAVAWYAASRNNVGAKKNAPAPIPVEVATAQLRDLTVHLYGLGTVQAWNTVTIHTRVDGQIEKIAFKEGQMVNHGDLLLQIDPRPFQATLEQAIAKKTSMRLSWRTADVI